MEIVVPVNTQKKKAAGVEDPRGRGSVFIPLCVSSEKSKQNAKKAEDLDADDEKAGEEDSHFMKLAKKLTAKTLQRKGQFDERPHKNNQTCFCQ